MSLLKQVPCLIKSHKTVSIAEFYVIRLTMGYDCYII